MRCKGTSRSSPGHGGDIAGGAKLSGSMGTAAREGTRAQGEGEKAAELTWIPMEASAGSGRHYGRRMGAGNLGCPR